MKSKLEARDRIFIKKLVVPALIGVLPSERESSQELLIDVDMSVDVREAANEDNLNKTIDYAQVRLSIIKFADESAFELIETLADRLASHLLNQFNIASIRLAITKRPFDITDAEGVGVLVEREAL